jgi:hypothetical protein
MIPSTNPSESPILSLPQATLSVSRNVHRTIVLLSRRPSQLLGPYHGTSSRLACNPTAKRDRTRPHGPARASPPRSGQASDFHRARPRDRDGLVPLSAVAFGRRAEAPMQPISMAWPTPPADRHDARGVGLRRRRRARLGQEVDGPPGAGHGQWKTEWRWRPG